MRKILFLDACVRPESRTRRLGQHILSHLEGQNPGFEYARTLTRTYHGIPEAHCFSADNLDVIGVDPEAVLARTCAEIDRILSV